ncbi:MAG: SDR family oxidoreductase, partial [Actinobacteria bacterium]|nr:SDR family oxidoreductase [Actinomycetota bacterium]
MPSATNRSVSALPIPLAAPVTTATFPSSSRIGPLSIPTAEAMPCCSRTGPPRLGCASRRTASRRRSRMIVERLRLDGRTVIVAGAGGGGIGSHTARAVAEAGANVVAVDIVGAALDQIVADLTAEGYPITPLVADARTDEGVATIVGAAVSNYGGVHGLINIIGVAAPHTWCKAEDVTREVWREVMDVNLDYAMFLSIAVAKQMIAQGSGGSIVSLSSTSGIGASPFHSAYGVAKGGIVAMVRTLAVEWGIHGIRVNAIAPGTISTPRSGADVGDAERDRRGVPLGRRGTPAD